MNQFKNRFLYVFLFLFVAAVSLTIVFRDSIAVYTMPKAVLAEAISHASQKLRPQLYNHPAQLLRNVLDPNSRQRIALDLNTTNALLGDIRYDMYFMTQPHQLYGEGIIYTDNNDLDLHMYMDTDYIAVSSEDLLNGSYYGITYHTFQEDIRSIPLLSWMLGDEIISEWDMSVKELQKKMQQERKLPNIPELSEDNMKALTLALLAMPADVDKTAILIQNRTLDCHRITYHISGEQLPDFLLQRLPVEQAESASFTAVFYLHKKELLLADISLTTVDKTYHVQMEMGFSNESSPITVHFSESTGSTSPHSKITLISSRNGDLYQDIWQIQHDDLRFSRIAYDWNIASGDMHLTVDDSETISLNAKETENGFSLEANDFAKLYSLFSKQASNLPPCNGKITIEPGAAFTAPQYKNLNQWSMDDFLILLEGLGGLMGLF